MRSVLSWSVSLSVWNNTTNLNRFFGGFPILPNSVLSWESDHLSKSLQILEDVFGLRAGDFCYLWLNGLTCLGGRETRLAGETRIPVCDTRFPGLFAEFDLRQSSTSPSNVTILKGHKWYININFISKGIIILLIYFFYSFLYTLIPKHILRLANLA